MLQENAYFVGDRLTWVDFLVFDLLEINIEFGKYTFGMKEVKPVDVLEKFPRLRNFFRLMSQRPRIAKYLNSSRRFPFKVSHTPKSK